MQTAADYERAKALTAQAVMSTQQLDLAKVQLRFRGGRFIRG